LWRRTPRNLRHQPFRSRPPTYQPAPIGSGQHLQLLTPEQKALFAAKPDDICYKIRAYIFKRDDDHAPELAGSTTCGPRQPRAQNAVWPKARLVPAD